jgi:Replication-relaxation
VRTSTKPYVLTAHDEKLLLTVRQFHYLTLDQFITYLGISEKSKNWLGGRLKTLKDVGYLTTQQLPRVESYGRNPLIYSLSPKGISHLRGLGFDTLEAADRPSSYLYLEHSLRVADILIAASLLEKSIPEITLATFKHDRDLHRNSVRVQVEKGRSAAVIPDGWLDFHLSPPYGDMGQRVCLCIEVDRNTVDITPFQQKIAYLTLFADGPYQEAFHTTSLTIAFLAAVGGISRVNQMKEWTKGELMRLKKTAFNDLFLFAALPDGVPSPVSLFTEPIFFTLENDLVSLIEKVM